MLFQILIEVILQISYHLANAISISLKLQKKIKILIT